MAHIKKKKKNIGLARMEQKMNNLAVDIDIVAQTCIDAASPAMESIYRGALGGSAPSDVAASTATTKAKKNMLGDFAVSRPVGYRQYGGGNVKTRRVRYGMMAALYNYGVKSHSITVTRQTKDGPKSFTYMHPGMQASPWHDRAVKMAEQVVSKIVEEKFESEVKRIIGQ